jgi:hypothetical protein
MEQGKPNGLLLRGGMKVISSIGYVGKDSAKSECLAVMTRIGFTNLHWKVADLHMGVALKSKEGVET